MPSCRTRARSVNTYARPVGRRHQAQVEKACSSICLCSTLARRRSRPITTDNHPTGHLPAPEFESSTLVDNLRHAETMATVHKVIPNGFETKDKGKRPAEVTPPVHEATLSTRVTAGAFHGVGETLTFFPDPGPSCGVRYPATSVPAYADPKRYLLIPTPYLGDRPSLLFAREPPMFSHSTTNPGNISTNVQQAERTPFDYQLQLDFASQPPSVALSPMSIVDDMMSIDDIYASAGATHRQPFQRSHQYQRAIFMADVEILRASVAHLFQATELLSTITKDSGYTNF